MQLAARIIPDAAERLEGRLLSQIAAVRNPWRRQLIWLQIRQTARLRPLPAGGDEPDRLKEAVATGHPRDKMYGVWGWAEPDVKDVGECQGATTPRDAARAEPNAAGAGPSFQQARDRPEGAGRPCCTCAGAVAMLGVEGVGARRSAGKGVDDRRAGALGPGEPAPTRRSRRLALLA
jgi:branched-chain amino acid transport system substrate-binding protein